MKAWLTTISRVVGCTLWCVASACGLARAADLRDYGARYDDERAVAIAGNDAAVEKLIANLPAAGGSIELRAGTLHLSKPIVAPNRWFLSGAPDYRPLNFAIDGQINSRIKLHAPAPGPAVVFKPNYPANYSDHNVRLRLSSVTVEGGTVEIEGGGKFTTIRELRCTGAPLGLSVRYFDGGALDDVYCYECEVGAKFSDCSLLQLNRFTVRQCKSDGLICERVGSVHGQLYLEANGGLQLVASDCWRWSPMLWLEDGTGRGNRLLAKRRNCLAWRFAGMDQDGLAWDDDPVSHAQSITATNADSFPPIGSIVAGKAERLAVYAGGPLVASEGMTLSVKPGGCDQAGQKYAEIRDVDTGWDEPFAKGDWVQIDADVNVALQTRTWLAGDWALCFGFLGGTVATKQNVRFTGDSFHVCAQERALADGRGLRLFLFLLAERHNDVELRFDVSNVVVRKLAN